MTMAIKPGVVVTYNEELPSIKLEEALTKWSWKVTRKIRVINVERW